MKKFLKVAIIVVFLIFASDFLIRRFLDPVILPSSTGNSGVHAEDKSSTSAKPVSSSYASIDNQIIYNENGCTVSVSNLKKNSSVDYCFTNNSDKDMYFNISGISVNGCMTYDTQYYGIATPGNKLVGTFDFNDYELYNINDISSLDICFYVTEKPYFINGAIHKKIKTNSEKNLSLKVNNLPIVYEDENIIAYFYDSGNDFENKNLIYYNKTNKVIMCIVSNAAVNGIMFSSSIWGTGEIAPKSYYYTAVGDGTITLTSPLFADLEKVDGSIKKITGEISYWIDDHWETSKNIVIFGE